MTLVKSESAEMSVAANALSISLGHDTSTEAMRHKEEAVLRLRAEGRSPETIARDAGVSRATVSRILRYVERAAAG